VLDALHADNLEAIVICPATRSRHPADPQVPDARAAEEPPRADRRRHPDRRRQGPQGLGADDERARAREPKRAAARRASTCADRGFVIDRQDFALADSVRSLASRWPSPDGDALADERGRAGALRARVRPPDPREKTAEVE